MSEKQFYIFGDNIRGNFGEVDKPLNNTEIVNLLNGQQERIKELKEENDVLSNLFDACTRGQKRIMQDNKKEEEALEKITEIIYRLNGVSDHE